MTKRTVNTDMSIHNEAKGSNLCLTLQQGSKFSNNFNARDFTRVTQKEQDYLT